MQKVRLMIWNVPLLMVLGGCSSTPPVNPPQLPPPAAWLMQPAPDLLTPLNGIISPSESESKPLEAK